MSKYIGSNLRVLGSTSIVGADREQHDFYATEPKAVELLLEEEQFQQNILEPCCGLNHITNVLRENGYQVTTSDFIDRGVGAEVKDFFDYTCWNGDIVTNPPYSQALNFVEHSLNIIEDGCKVAMFLKIQFLEGKKRKEFFKNYPPKYIYVASGRLRCAKNGEFESYKSSPVCYAWFIWEKGFQGEPSVRWIN
mgnify:CR=1 FL=1|jgi:hypothetical protein|nr:MAG TPA: adenine-specific methyltransferase [Caudoviricetes sp.]